MSHNEHSVIKSITDQISAETIFNQHLVESVLSTFDLTSPYTTGRTSRVLTWARSLGKYLQMEDIEIREIEIAALFCDLGMLAIPHSLINKNGRLTLAEFKVVQYHPELSLKALEGIALGDRICTFILHHQESYDGSGYPNGLVGDTIPLGAQVINLSCTLFSLTATRPYREPVTPEHAVQIIGFEEGNQFAPKIVQACREMNRDGVISQVLEKRINDPFSVIKQDTLLSGSPLREPHRIPNAKLSENSNRESVEEDPLQQIRSAIDK